MIVTTRLLALVWAGSLAGGCYVEHVAGERVSAGGSGSGSGSSTAMGVDAGASTTVVGDDTASGDTTGDGGSSSTGAPVSCDAPMGHQVCDEGNDPFQAIGLGCPGSADDSTPLVGSTFASVDETAWRIARELGNAFWTPREGSNLLVLSTGTLPLPDASGRIELAPAQTHAADGDNGNPDDASLPAPISAAPGSNGGAGGTPFMGCDGVGDCSETLPGLLGAGPVNDLLSMSFDVAVPGRTRGFRVDVAWLSAEFPARVDAAQNDAFVLWVSSEAYVGNIATDAGRPMTATGLRPRLVEAELHGDAPALIGTGMAGSTGGPCTFPWADYAQCPRGAASGWLTLDGPANPGEILTVTAALFDHGDTELDTIVLLDDWRWHCAGCTPGESCGVSTAP